MLSIYDKGAAPHCPTPFNLTAYVLTAGQRTPDKTALSVVSTDQETDCWSYQRLSRAIMGTARGLLNAGARSGDRILIRLGNSVEFPIAYLAAIAADLVPVPTSPQLTKAEVSIIIDDLQPALTLHAPGTPCPDIPHRITVADLHEMYDLPPCQPVLGDPERMAYIVYTSGTSGKPRAVAHAHRAIWARRMMIRDWYDLRPDDRLMHAGAFNWTFTLGTGLLDPWTVGGTALIPDSGITPEEMPTIMQHHRITMFAAVPGVYRKILQNNQPLSLPLLRHGLSAGEKLSDSLKNQWHRATGTEIYEAFGMSECSTFISSGPRHPSTPGSLGTAQQGRKVAIVGDDGPLPMGTTGTIAIHRDDPGLMLEYIGAPEETQARFQGDWFLTGDHAIMTEDGQFIYQGRTDDMMNAGGYRVSPLEIETVLVRYPGITQVAVTDIEVKPDVHLIMAFYMAPAPVPDAKLYAYMAEYLAEYKRPREFFHVDSLPVNLNGKIQRRQLSETYRMIHGQT